MMIQRIFCLFKFLGHFLWPSVFIASMVVACGGGGSSHSTPAPAPSPLHIGMPQVNIEQNSMTVTLGFSGELILGFLPATKETRLADVAKVCVDSDTLGWADYSTRCVAPDSSGVAIVTNTVTNDCFQLHLKLKDGSIVWGNIDNLVMTGRPAMKTVLTSGTQCLKY